MEIEKILISLKDVFPEAEGAYAHVSADMTKKETVYEHTSLCQKYFLKLVKRKGLERIFEEFETEWLKGMSEAAKCLYWRMAVNVVTFHDTGKINPSFQKNKMKNMWHLERIGLSSSLGSRHAIISAIFYLEYFLKEIEKLEIQEERNRLKDLVYIFSYIISRHHTDLISFEEYLNSFSAAGMETFTKKEKDTSAMDAKKWVEAWRNQEGRKFKIKGGKRWNEMLERLAQDGTVKSVYLYGITRLLYSLLLSSDYYATTEFMAGMEIDDFGEIDDAQNIGKIYESGELIGKIREYERTRYPMPVSEWEKEDDINQLRSELFLDAEKELLRNMEQSVFYLEAPTGSGKSNTALNLSFQLIKKDSNIQKIFYIYPFNTLVEQNMESLGKVFENQKEVLTQIAVVNSLVPLKNREAADQDISWYDVENYQKILLDRQFLNYPIVLSTHVMLYTTLFGKNKEDAFGFHQLCNSVIVIDEIQCYKIGIWAESITFLKALAKLLNIKIIIMSATLPDLDLLTGYHAYTARLIQNRNKYFNHKKFAQRVQIDYGLLDGKISMEDLADFVCASAEEHKKVLIEFIKVKSAEKFYCLIKERALTQVLLMTGASSILERKQIIEKTRSMDSVVLVATQVIEAGVDIDMDIGFKNISRLDSEEQFMGRINRSGRKNGKVYFFFLDNPGKLYKNDVRAAEEVTVIRSEIRRYLADKNFAAYYADKIIPWLKQEDDMLNENNLRDFFRYSVGRLHMPHIEEKMKLIEDERQMISVFFAREIVNEKEEVIDGKNVWGEYRALLENREMKYAERKVKLFDIRSKMNLFLYQFTKESEEKISVISDECIGGFYYIEAGEDYFDKCGVLIRSVFGDDENLFI